MKKLKINYGFILEYYLVLTLMGMIFAIYKNNIFLFLSYLFLVFVIDFIPTLYIILNYLEYNSKTEVMFFEEAISVVSKNFEKTILIDQINQIFIFASPFIIKKRKLRFSVHESLFYARIKMKD